MLWQIYLLAWICGSFFAVWLLPGALAFALLLYSAKKLLNFPRFIFAVGIFIFAALLIDGKLTQWDEASSPLPLWLQGNGPYKGQFCGEIIESQGLPNRRVRLSLSKVYPAGSPQEESLPMLCSLVRETPDPFSSFLPGQSICFKGSIRKLRPNLNSSADLDNPIWKIRGVLWQSYSKARSSEVSLTGKPMYFYSLRESLRHKFLLALGFQTAKQISEKEWQSPKIQAKAILLALCFGDRQLLSYNTSDNFAAATIAHSLALSGQHLGIAGLAAILFVYFIGRWRPKTFLRCPRLRLTLLLAIPLALLYLWIGNAPPSLCRAAAMLGLIAFFVWRGSAFSGVDLICGAILLFILFKPLLIFDLGLQLSAICVLLIIIFIPAITELSFKLPRFGKTGINKFIRGAFQILLISLIIQIFLLPLNLQHFAIAGFYFSLNLLWLPVLGLFVLPLAFFAIFISLFPGSLTFWLASLALKLAALPCQGLLLILNKLRSLNFLDEQAFMQPHWLLIIIFALLAGSLAWLLAHRKSPNIRKICIRFFALALILLFVPPALRLFAYFHTSLRIELLDVGQGLSVNLYTPKGLHILYDGGGNPKSHFDPGKNIIAPLLSSNSAPKIDVIINSHPDMDHLGGLFYLLEKFNITSVYHNGRQADGNANERWRKLQKADNYHTLYAGDSILLDNEKNGLRLEVLHPPALIQADGSRIPDPAWRGNHASLVLRLCRGDEGLLLLCGDAEKDSLKHILKEGRDLRTKVLIAPHHGSDRSLVKDFYRKAAPDLVLVGCSFQNRWHYPGKRLRAFLKEQDIQLLDSGSLGKIKVNFEEDKIAVETLHKDKSLSWKQLYLRLMRLFNADIGDRIQ